MNKKVKWSVISISTITALTFGGLVTNSQKGAGNESPAPGNESLREKLSLFNEEGGFEGREYGDDDYYEGRGDDDEFEEHGYDDDDDYEEHEYDDDGNEEHDDDHRYSRQDQESSWGQDQFMQAPNSGFQQDQGSSRTSRD